MRTVAWDWQQDTPVVNENTKIKLEPIEEKGIPHFYADYDLIIELFKGFKIEDILYTQRIIEKNGIRTESWNYHILIKK